MAPLVWLAVILLGLFQSTAQLPTTSSLETRQSPLYFCYNDADALEMRDVLQHAILPFCSGAASTPHLLRSVWYAASQNTLETSTSLTVRPAMQGNLRAPNWQHCKASHI
ncbi:hypothetical protein BAUCODRAFT_119996 [Baudoinia panamericana UAMH 10762]|uniref:Secreted protein n=1 Tax=Baudoinia panamericana (strain UAMH 10762) TaxID=717646 RepID=M2LVL4_BAUPA|nr:uncharacterized protein BAUCODRAFT_119996 [Baudoinia panamericana UAMH 10762]EMC98692.1 hypothetical protein BAUCODRAFT_119996 [Baudoinia panamericana UAMH 10762]